MRILELCYCCCVIFRYLTTGNGTPLCSGNSFKFSIWILKKKQYSFLFTSLVWRVDDVQISGQDCMFWSWRPFFWLLFFLPCYHAWWVNWVENDCVRSRLTSFDTNLMPISKPIFKGSFFLRVLLSVSIFFYAVYILVLFCTALDWQQFKRRERERGLKKGASNYAKILHVGLTAVVELLHQL